MNVKFMAYDTALHANFQPPLYFCNILIVFNQLQVLSSPLRASISHQQKQHYIRATF